MGRGDGIHRAAAAEPPSAAPPGKPAVPDGAPELAGLAMCALLAWAWLMPSHYLPWPAFHSDAAAAVALLVGAAGTLWLAGPSVRWSAASAVLAAVALVPLAQHAAGLVYFLGDAVMPALYLAGLAVSLQIGATLQRRGASALVPLLITLLFVGLASTFIALLQWLRLTDLLGGLAVEIDRMGRPFANFAQPNQFATFLMLSLAAGFALHQQGRIGTPVLMAAAALLSLGVALSRSRAGLLEMATLIVMALAVHRRAGLRFPRGGLVALGLWFALVVAVWTPLSELLYLADSRDGVMGSSTGRVELWRQLAAAAWQRPWFGYGWNQVAVAQSSVAASFPAYPLQVELSHNLLLDLVLWNGLPLGLLLAAAIAVWLWRLGRACRDAVHMWCLVGIAAFLAHAMAEFPHAYAYLLFPVGILAGAIEDGTGAARWFSMPRRVAAVIPLAGVAMVGWVLVEYMVAEADYRAMRLENARIGTGVVSEAVPPLVLLTPLREFLHVARHSVTPAMSREDLQRLQRVSERFGYPPVLFRRALAEALNGNPQVAAEMLKRLCHMHEKRHCIEGLDAWAAMLETKPALAAVVLPPRP